MEGWGRRWVVVFVGVTQVGRDDGGQGIMGRSGERSRREITFISNLANVWQT
jgi:hypothetical protein